MVSRPAQGRAYIARHSTGKIESVNFEPVSEWTEVFFPEGVHFLGLPGQRLLPAGLRLIDRASAIRAEIVREAGDEDLRPAVRHGAFDHRTGTPPVPVCGDTQGLGELLEQRLFLRLRGRRAVRAFRGLLRLGQRQSL